MAKANQTSLETYDYVVIGSGFGGSVSAMRLVEKGYSVLVLERGKRFRDEDFARTNWIFWKYLWAPGLRSFGILQISPFRDVFVLHGSGVGGGSLGYANVLVEPSDELFENPLWKNLADWKTLLQPHFHTARRMLGVTENPRLWPSDNILRQIAGELGAEDSFKTAPVGTFFGKPDDEGKLVPDPYFNGEGPDRRGCTHCGACMIGCRYNSKNTLEKNYLFLAEKWGAEIWAECEVRDIQPLLADQLDEARYEVVYRSSTNWLAKPEKSVRARNVILSAGSLGTQRLLFRCREITQSLPLLSERLGEMVRTNNEALLGVTNRDRSTNFSEGVAITSIFQADEVTSVEPVRYPAGSSLMRFLSGPLIESSGGVIQRLLKTIGQILTRPGDFARTHILPAWAERSTILLVMQTEDNWIKMRLGRSWLTLWKKNLVSSHEADNSASNQIQIGHQITRRFADKTNGIASGTINESVMNIPMTAHILGGCPMGLDDQQGVVGLDLQIHNYPGLFAVDGSVMPANPGVNPSLTITAMSEYAMSLIPPKPGAVNRPPFIPMASLGD
ncbi:MAG: GMC family oxidoreductase [Anaerolineales bacterium]|jgi:cholesterol oxidase|nr:GMC family oxidoreductase [Anaerolineales bacterium]